MTSPRPLVIVGAGGFGREVINIVRAINTIEQVWTLVGVADDRPSAQSVEALARSGTTLLGDVHTSLVHAHPQAAVAVAIGDPLTRERIVDMLPPSTSFPSLVHPAATVGDSVRLGPGCLIAPGARLSADISIGRHVHIDQNVTVGHDTTVGDYSRLNPMACISGGIRLGRLVYVGSNATVLQSLRIGDRSVVGAGAVVVSDVPADRTVKGVPAK